ncbi:MAG: hypothetical protein ACPGYF_05230 [Chitinophagales bacterium]
MKKLFVLTLFFLSTTLLAQNIPSIEQVEAELEEIKKKDDLRTFAIYLIKQRDSLIEVFNRQISTLEQELSSTEASLSEVEFDFDNAMTSIEALNQNKTMLENNITQLLANIESLKQNKLILEDNNSQQEAELTNLYAQITVLNTTIGELESNLEVPISDTLLPFNDHYDADITLEMLGISSIRCVSRSSSNSSKYFPLRQGGEEATEEHKSPLFYQWHGISENAHSDENKSQVLLLNVNNEIVLLPMISTEETYDDLEEMEGSGFTLEELVAEGYIGLTRLTVYQNSQYKAVLTWENITGGALACDNFGCSDCEGWGTGFCHLELYKNGQSFYEVDVAECSLNKMYCR